MGTRDETRRNWGQLKLVPRRQRANAIETAHDDTATANRLSSEFASLFDVTAVPEPAAHRSSSAPPAVLVEGVDAVASGAASLSAEDRAERAEWRQDLHELAWRLTASRPPPRRSGEDLYPAAPRMGSEPPGPMAWHVDEPTAEQLDAGRPEIAPPAPRRSRSPAGPRPALKRRVGVLALVVFSGVLLAVSSDRSVVAAGAAVAGTTSHPADEAGGASSETTDAAQETPAEPLEVPVLATMADEPPTSVPAPEPPKALPPVAAAIRGGASAHASTKAEKLPTVVTAAPIAAWLDVPAGDFSRSAAAIELASVAGRAPTCRSDDETEPVTAEVRVTFAPSGEATSAFVTGPLAGTSAGACVARLFRGARVPRFDGESVTVHKTVVLR